MEQFRAILIHYIQVAWQQAGLSWDWENAGEITDAVERLESAVDQMVQDRVNEALRAHGLIKEG
jgi:hypothetical protein